MAHMTAAERIKEYKQLLDEGMITQEEFEIKKQKILEMDEIVEDAAQDAAKEAPKNDDGVFSGHYFQDKANNEQQDPNQNANRNQNQSGENFHQGQGKKGLAVPVGNDKRRKVQGKA